MRQNLFDLAVIPTPLRVKAISMTRTSPKPSVKQPSPDPKQTQTTQPLSRKASPSMWGSSPKVWAKWGWRGLFLSAVCVVAWQSLQPATAEQGILHLDKLLHLLAYAVLMVLALLGRLPLKAVWLAFIITTLGVGLEVLQGTMNLGRTASLADAVANTAGVALVYGAWRLINR